MKKLAIMVVAVAGLILLGAAKTDACSTHGYVRASTLNDLFSSVADSNNGIEFAAPGSTNGGSNALSDPNLDTGHYDDGHAFSWKVKGQNGGNWTFTPIGSPQQQLDGIIADIEQAVGESFDKSYSD